MAVSISHRFRFVTWFLSAYLRKYSGFILLGFFAGLLLSVLVSLLPTISPTQLVERENVVGLVGQYSLSSLPLSLQQKLSFGLTTLDSHDQVKPGAASSWEIKNNGSSYIFHLRRDLTWQDGSKFRSFDVNLRLKDVEILALGDYELEFKLKNPLAALPSIVSQPLFKNGLIGLGPQKASRIVLNNGSLSSLEIVNPKTNEKILYKFYKTSGEAILALKLHQINSLEGLNSVAGTKTDKTISWQKQVDYHKFVALFFNTGKDPFKEKKVRLGFTYALPNSFGQEEEALGPINKKSWAYNSELKNYLYNKEQSQKYLKDILNGSATSSASFVLKLSTMPVYRSYADQIAKNFRAIGIKTKVWESETPPPNFDVFLGAIATMPDPDQYIFWHSGQANNITATNNPRVDKLLEEGRTNTNQKERKQIYQDFQKYLVEDDDAAFLFYPATYTVTRI